MAIEIRCACGNLLQARDEWAGRRARCPRCKTELVIPAPAAAPLPELGGLDDLLSEQVSSEIAAPAVQPPSSEAPARRPSPSLGGRVVGMLKKLTGTDSIAFKWNEPAWYRLRLRGDLGLRLATALGAWAAAAGVLLVLFGINVNPPGIPLAFFLGAVFGLGPALLVLYARREHGPGVVTVTRDAIRRQRTYAALAYTHVGIESSEWPYEAIGRCVLVPGNSLGKSFSVMLLAADSRTEILGVPRKINLEELGAFLASKGVAVERGRSVPARFTKKLDVRIAAGAAIVGVIGFLGGLGFYFHKVGGHNRPQADAREDRDALREEALRGWIEPPRGPMPGDAQPPWFGDVARGSGETELVGGPGGGPFRIQSPGGEPIVGFRYHLGSWAGTKALALLDPLFSRDLGFGPDQTVLAREGYAVGAIRVDAGQYVCAVQIVFMRLAHEGRLDPADSYTSEWLGSPAGNPPKTLGGTGSKVIGVFGRRAAVIDAIGLVVEE